MILCIIFTCIFVISIVLLVLYSFKDWTDEKTLIVIIISLIVSAACMILSAATLRQDIKAIEYPASEYDFKIKVVEFEEHRDTILVVTPKDKIK